MESLSVLHVQVPSNGVAPLHRPDLLLLEVGVKSGLGILLRHGNRYERKRTSHWTMSGRKTLVSFTKFVPVVAADFEGHRGEF